MGKLVVSTVISGDSLLVPYFPGDYADSYEREVVGGRTIMPDEFFDLTFNRSPKWVEGLMKLRNALVKPLGLKCDGRIADRVCGRNEREIVFGMPDKHLTFHASLWCGEPCEGRQRLRITTVVSYNNWLGRVYFFFIRPFHGLIMRSSLRRVAAKRGQIKIKN